MATSLKVNIEMLVNACSRQKSLLSELPGVLFNWQPSCFLKLFFGETKDSKELIAA